MQYILTEEEYQRLVPIDRFHSKIDIIQRTNEEILKLANYQCRSEMATPLSFVCDNCPIGRSGTDSCHEIGQ